MKKIAIGLCAVLALNAKAQNTEERSLKDLVGMWRSKSGNGLDIVDSNTVYVVHGDQRRLASATILEPQKNPVGFDLVVKDSSKTTTLKGLLLRVNDETLRWQVFDSETKPVNYSGYRRGDALYMKRISNLTN